MALQDCTSLVYLEAALRATVSNAGGQRDCADWDDTSREESAQPHGGLYCELKNTG